MKRIALVLGAAVLAACAPVADTDPMMEPVAAVSSFDRAALTTVLAAQPEDTQARYAFRHPLETLEFFGIAPGMTVVDVLPGAKGEGWYTPILASYLGSGNETATLVGVDYSLDMWPEFGGFATPEFLEGKKSWGTEWVSGAEARLAAGDFGDADIDFAATTFSADNAAFAGMADAVLFMRAMHNLARFEDKGGYMTTALADAYAMLKPGGIVGVVQHRAPTDAAAGWATGENGYLKQQDVIDAFTAAGFEFVRASEVNANPLDRPDATEGSEDSVWRLPPTLATSRIRDEDDAATRAEKTALRETLKAVGESDRMTLLFRKPS